MIIVLSGEIASGKSSLAAAIGFPIFRTRSALSSRWHEQNGTTPSRVDLQNFGEELDAQTEGSWIAQAIPSVMPVGAPIVVDSVRTAQQVDAIRAAFPRHRVLHVHLEASEEALRARFEQRGDVESYELVKRSPTEQRVNSLRVEADLVIDTSRCSRDDVMLRFLSLVGPINHEPLVDVIVGGQYGSEGKGHVVSHIAPGYRMLLRVGGPNAGHTVIDPKTNQKFSFYHLPSGALHAPTARLVLGPGAVINYAVLKKEAEILGGLDNLVGRLYVDPQAQMIDELDIESEARLVRSIGSTGQGVGSATARKILGRNEQSTLARDFEPLKKFLCPTLDLLEESYQLGEHVLLEGTQGTGLSLHHGHYPYVTSRDTAASGTAGEAGVAPRRIRKSIVVMRTNPIRVQSPEGGTSGPMGIETTWEEISKRAGIPADTLREKEKTTTTKRQRRVAEFCWSDLRRAVLLNSPTDIALTFVDYISHDNTKARRYEQLTPETLRFIEEIERVAGAPVSLVTTRFHRRSIIDRRSW